MLRWETTSDPSVTAAEPAPHLSTSDAAAWKAALREDARRTFRSGGYPLALMGAGWVHMGFFLACQAIRDPEIQSDPRHPLLWIGELVAVIVAIRLLAGRGWWNRSQAALLVVRLWVTLLILSFNLATMNALTGWEHDWFKPVWGTLSTFFFAALAWLFDLRFLILAVQMYGTGLLMVRFPDWNYLIYGASWCVALQVVGWSLRRRV